MPRLAPGSFNELLKSLFKTHTGYELTMSVAYFCRSKEQGLTSVFWCARDIAGKPTPATFTHATSLLHAEVRLHEGPTTDKAIFKDPAFKGKVYMVGDNPSTDIAGANRHGWESILVKTGIFKGSVEDLPSKQKPTAVCADVLVCGDAFPQFKHTFLISFLYPIGCSQMGIEQGRSSSVRN